MPRRRLLALAVALVPVAYLALWPVDADPEAWSPPEGGELVGAYAVNDGLAGHTVLHPEYHGAEAVTFDAEGRIVTGLLDGRIVRFAVDGAGAGETLANTGGRPLGLRYDRGGRLIVADAHRGLLEVGDAGAVKVLVDTHGGKPIRFCDDLAIAGDGTIYFSDASFLRSVEEWRVEVIEHRPNGRLLAYHPERGETTLVLGDLYFANGVALGPDEASVVVTELSSYRVTRVWLAGPKKGEHEVLIDDLPGFPDNITYSPERGAYWIALGSPRNGLVDGLSGWPGLRKAVLRLPEALQPAPVKHAIAVAVDDTGKVVAAPQYVDPSAYSPVSSVLEREGWLYLGSFAGDGVAKVKAPGVG
ncbi:MAG: SMP-30/gluconolactonase/LRE family protein [Nannocystaceae bacterium]